MSRFVYADNAATTKMDKDVFEIMIKSLEEDYGNPSSIYKKGRDAKVLIEKARKQVADGIGAKESEIIFTSGGSESDNYAIKGIAKAKANKGKHIISSKIEHHAVLHTLEALSKEGYEITYLDVLENGIIDIEELKKAIREDTILITIMFANNEIGTIQPVEEIGKIARENKIIFHTDAVQAVGHVKVDVNEMNIDMLSMSAHKFGGPKGVGALYIKSGIKPENFIFGGAQERGKRAGTENTASIIAMGAAIEKITSEMEKNTIKVQAMRDKLIDTILEKIPYTRLNGDREKRLPGNVNISFRFIEGESLLLMLDLKGICASSGSACTSGSLDPSHVLLSIGLPHEIAHGSLRLSINHENTMEDVEYILEVLPQVVERLREMSPLYDEINKKG
ncbi:MAG: cysteine desulfurase NifS [Clostridia bacterium]|nr:cysteine desulfurase NifS [Clostridia bacterium]